MRTSTLTLSLVAVLRAWPRALGVGLAVGLCAAPVHAEDGYRRHMENGVKLYADKNYAAALAEFEAAYKIRPNPSPLIDIALCHKALFKYARAIEALELALDRHASTIEPADKVAAEDAIVEMRKLLAHVSVRVTPRGAALTVDGEAVPDAGADRPIPLGPGTHKIGASLAGHTPVEREISVVSGEARSLELALVPAAPRPEETETRMVRNSTAMMVTGIVAGSLGILSAGAGAVSYGVGVKQEDGGSCDPTLNKECRSPKELKNGGIALMVLGGVGMAVGIPLFFVGARKVAVTEPRRSARPEVFLGPGSAAARWTF